MAARLGSASSTCSVTTFDANEVPISVDLVETARFLLDFLSEISAKPELHEGPLVECAIQRYERYWLPLVAKHPGRLLPAPLDIEWIWHCHMLCPEAYHTDCNNIVGKLIDHHLVDRTQRKELLNDSERLWRLEYADVPFSACDAVTPWFDCEFVSALRYDLALAVSRQKVFYYQVSLPHYRDEKFLNNGLMRYKKFLFLKCHNPGLFLVPCYDNDLLWHTHLLHPKFYKADTEAYLGLMLPHDDSVNDRSPNSKLGLAEAKTRNLWRKVFNEKYSQFGAMYRGEPPMSKLYALSREDIHKVCTKQVNVLVEKARVSGLPPGKSYKLKLCYNTGYQNFNRSLFVTENITTIKGNSRTLEDCRINTHFQFDTRYNDKLIASLQQKSGKLCLGTNDVVGEGKIDMQKKIQPLHSRGLTANDDIDCGDGLSVGVVWSCPAPVLGPCVLRLEPDEYVGCEMPADREAMWGPIPLPRVPPNFDNFCSVASHKLFNHTRRAVFTVRMIHSEPLLMSAIHVFYGDKLAAVAHLVVGDQLPLPLQVSSTKTSVTLNPKEGQRAVLIKNNKGDWGIAVGWWEGLPRRLQGRKGSCSEGHLEIRFYHLPDKKWHYVSFDRLYSLATSKFEVGDCVVEFDSGFFEISSLQGEIVENLALIFSVALIHVLCQPRPTSWKPKLTSIRPEDEPLPRLGGSEEIALLLAAGVTIATPCNYAIKNMFKKKKQQYGEGGSLQSGSQRQSEDQYDLNGGPAVILHEAEVSAGWGEDRSSGAGGATSNVENALEAGVVMGGALAVIKEQEDDREDSEKAADEEEAENATERTALLTVEERSDQEEEETTGNGLSGTHESEGDEEKAGTSADLEDGDDEDDEEEDRSDKSEGVFEVDDYNIDADSQTGLFGNGEDDSDEVELEEEDSRFGRANSREREEAHSAVYAVNHDHSPSMGEEDLPPPPSLNGSIDAGFDNDVDTYYKDFYNPEDEGNINGFGGSGSHSGMNHHDHEHERTWDSFTHTADYNPVENHIHFDGFGSTKYGDMNDGGLSVDGTDGFGKDVATDGHIGDGGHHSGFTSALLFGGGGTGGNTHSTGYGDYGGGGGGILADGACGDGGCGDGGGGGE